MRSALVLYHAPHTTSLSLAGKLHLLQPLQRLCSKLLRTVKLEITAPLGRKQRLILPKLLLAQ
jgi:hypothetical protein